MRRPAALVLSVGLLFAGCGGANEPTAGRDAGDAGSPRPASVLSVPGTDAELHVEIASDAEERARGLMGRALLPPDQGMVFLFDGLVTNAFWMKNVRIPLSIAFWDQGRRIVDIVEMEPCDEEPCPVYRSRAAYVGAVEANAGYFAEHGVRPGDPIELQEGPEA